MEIPALGFDLPDVDQVAVVVEDIVDGMDRYGAILGVEPWTVYRFEPPDLTDQTYYGEDVENGMLLALAEVGGIMIELIEPTIGPNIYQDHLEEHGEGLHHIAYFGWDEEETYDIIDQFTNAGISIIQSGDYAGTEYWYLDTAVGLNGLVFETAIRRNVHAREPAAIYPKDPFPPEQ